MANERWSEFVEESPKVFVQGLFDESSTAKHALGTKRKLMDGREYVYCQMGATAGVAGQLYQGVVIDIANQANLTVANANIGDRTISVTVGDTAIANTANFFADGFVHVNTGAANGMAYKIKSHPAVAANAVGVFTLYDKIRNANLVTSTSKVSLTQHPCKAVIVHPSPPTAVLTGVCTYPVTANYYAWLQTKGPCPVEVEVAVAAGKQVCASNAVNGAVTIVPSDANGIVCFSLGSYPVGNVITNNANDHWALIDLNL
jgi:hypothetical protein